MATAYEKFLNLATSNTIRCTNQYEIFPTSGDSDIDAVLENARLMTKDFTIPQRSIEYANVSFKGYEAPLVPTRMTMDQEITMNVIADVNGEYRRAFLKWMNRVIDANIEGGSVFAGDRGVNPKSLIRLQLFDKDNETVIETYKFFNVQISNVGQTSLTYEGGEAAAFPVTFKCTYWTIEKSEKGALTEQV